MAEVASILVRVPARLALVLAALCVAAVLIGIDSSACFLCLFVLLLHADDHLGGITNCSGNVMYKAAGRSFLTNGGAGAPNAQDRTLCCCFARARRTTVAAQQLRHNRQQHHAQPDREWRDRYLQPWRYRRDHLQQRHKQCIKQRCVHVLWTTTEAWTSV